MNRQIMAVVFDESVKEGTPLPSITFDFDKAKNVFVVTTYPGKGNIRTVVTFSPAVVQEKQDGFEFCGTQLEPEEKKNKVGFTFDDGNDNGGFQVGHTAPKGFTYPPPQQPGWGNDVAGNF